jgi:proline iminopeptidase
MPGAGHQVARDQFVGTGAARLYVRDVGHGVPIVVVHGGPDFDHEYLVPELDDLAAAFHLVYYDQRGRGRSFSGRAPTDVSITTEVDDLDRVRDRFGFGSVALLGHSWGSLLAMEYAIRLPHRVTHLILMNTAPASHAGRLVFRRALESGRSNEESERMAALRSDPRYRAGDVDADLEWYRLHFSSAVGEREQLERLIRRLRSAFTGDGILVARAIEDRLYEQTWDAEDYDLLPELHRLRVPSLVIHGDKDLVPVAVARGIADAIPGSRFVLLRDCGHFAYLERPDEVRRYIAALLPPA